MLLVNYLNLQDKTSVSLYKYFSNSPVPTEAFSLHFDSLFLHMIIMSIQK